MKTHIVLGLGFGDEGKGLCTDYLVVNSINPIVVRFSGGQNAGHCVTTKEYKHIFSNFGSGALRGAPTFWSKYCTFYPTGVVNEYEALKNMGIEPVLYVDPLAMVTTPFDIAYNRYVESSNGHGSVGVGFGATIERNESPYKLYVQDLQYEKVWREKLKAIIWYYDRKVEDMDKFDSYLPSVNVFMDNIRKSLKIFKIKDYFGLQKYGTVIFEGSQGILLDQDFGFFPNVTRANTTSLNASEIIEDLDLAWPETWYVTRCYQTRHGNGYMSDEGRGDIDNFNETNLPDEWQGFLRKGYLDVDLLNYALNCNRTVHEQEEGDEHLLVTCLDHVDKLRVIKDREVIECKGVHDITDMLHFAGYPYTSRSPISDNI